MGGAASWPAAATGRMAASAAASKLETGRRIGSTRGLLLPTAGCGSRVAQDPGIGDDGDAAALGLRELPGDDAAHDAAPDLVAGEGRIAGDQHRARGAAVGVDLPPDGDLAVELGVQGELLLVAVPHLVGVIADHLPDELGVDRAQDPGLAGGHVDVAVALRPEAAHARPVPAEAAAAPLGADPADADGLALAAASRAGALQPQPAHAVAVADHGPEHVADRALEIAAQAALPEDGGEAASRAPSLAQRREQARVLDQLLGVRIDRARCGAPVRPGRVLLAHLALAALVPLGHLAP